MQPEVGKRVFVYGHGPGTIISGPIVWDDGNGGEEHDPPGERWYEIMLDSVPDGADNPFIYGEPDFRVD